MLKFRVTVDETHALATLTFFTPFSQDTTYQFRLVQRTRSHPSQPPGAAHGLIPSMDTKFLQNLVGVFTNSVEAEDERVGNLSIRLALRQQLQHLAFTRRHVNGPE